MLNMPAGVRMELKAALALCRMAKDRTTEVDFGMIFAKHSTELKQRFSGLKEQLAPTGMLWVSWPKKASGVATDLDENEVRRIGLEAGLVDVKVCAINDVWSGLKFVFRLKDRAKSR